MANNLDLFPVDDPITDGNSGRLSNPWRNFLTMFNQNLTEYLGEYGIVPPSLTSAQRDSIQSPRNGQTIYNTTSNVKQYYRNGMWTDD